MRVTCPIAVAPLGKITLRSFLISRKTVNESLLPTVVFRSSMGSSSIISNGVFAGNNSSMEGSACPTGTDAVAAAPVSGDPAAMDSDDTVTGASNRFSTN